jgi:hypothetical protein
MATQPDPDYILTGRITNWQGEPLEGLIACAYDQDPKTPENLLPLESMSSAGADHSPRGG